jgi:predicted short-subunit dehydrogenase-like oxidoreductase (DUF2520 family)
MRESRGSPSKRRRLQVVMVGPGRLGGAMARGLLAARQSVSGWSPDARSAGRWRALGVPPASPAATAWASLWILSVPDDAIRAAHQAVLPHLGPKAVCVHCAGARTLAVLRLSDRGRPCGSFHPLCAISGPTDTLAGHAVAIAGTHSRVRAQLEQLARVLGLMPLRVPEQSRSRYHAGAVLGAGAVVALLSLVEELWVGLSMPPAAARRALLALTRSALGGAERRGWRNGLTGPWVRGDVERVRAHLEALPSHAWAAYQSLGLQGLALAKDSLSQAQQRAMKRLLLRGRSRRG